MEQKTMYAAYLLRAFSLVEMLITLGVISILAAIAYPSYQQYLVRANSAATKAYLLELSSLQTEFIFENHSYTDSLANLGASPKARVSEHYEIAIVNVAESLSPPSFTLQAVPKTNSPQHRAGTLWLNHLGQTSDNWDD